MKKKFCSFALLATAGVGSMFMSACGDPALESISIKEDSIETTLLVNSPEPDWKDLVLNLTYDNDDTATATKNSDMTISRIDTSVLGTQELVVTYKGLTTKIKINIVAHEGDLYEFLGYEKPDSYVLYEDSVRQAKKEGEDNFMLGTHRYKVGDDNEFVFLPKITAINQSNQTVTVTEYTSDVVVKENGVELTGEELEAVVAIDNINSAFDFTPAAVGRTFEITVKPLNYDEEEASYDPITITVDVVNAWNVYDVANLSRVEANTNSTSLWAAKKAENNIDNTEIEGVVLHKNLEITKKDLPEGMFYGDNVTDNGKDVSNSLKDRTSFYTRDIDANDTFSIYGNYFTISTRNTGEDAIPLGKDFDSDDFAHSAIFAFGGDNNYAPGDPQGRVVINSLNLVGNGFRQSGSESTNDGALIAVLSSAHNTTLENCITRAFTTHIITTGEYNYPTANEIALVVRNSKMFDSFSSMVYTWATRNSYIENSVLKKSGGPLVMATHPRAKEHPEYFSNINIKDSVIENYVGGSEAWFQKTGAAAIISYLRVISGLLEQTSAGLVGNIEGIENISSFTTNGGAAINFLSCNLGEDTVMQSDPIKSSNIIKDAEGNVINEQDMKDELIAMLDNTDPRMTAMPIFKAGSVYVTLDPGSLTEIEESPLPIPGGLALIYVAQSEAEVQLLQGSPIALIALNDLLNPATQSGQLYLAFKDKVDAMLVEFMNSDYINMFYNGPRLGATFEMFHTAPQA